MAPTFTIHAQKKSLLNSHGIKEFFQSNDIYAIIFMYNKVHCQDH